MALWPNAWGRMTSSKNAVRCRFDSGRIASEGTTTPTGRCVDM